MIDADELGVALYALQGVLVKARNMAYKKEDYSKIAELLDYAEELPWLLASDDNRTKEFKEAIAQIAKKFNCYYVLQSLESEAPPGW